jgi:hypothetical protein
MQIEFTQRWNEQRDSYRPAGELINTRDYEVAELRDDKRPKAFVQRHHYSASYPAARYRFGLYQAGSSELVGVAVYSVPANSRCLDILPCERSESVELGRFVLLDHVPGNAESWFIGQCHRQLVRHGVRGIVSFSDPVPRTTEDGTVLFRGHLGIIYQATNAVYLGTSRAETRRLLPDGRLLHGRSLAKVRKRDRGYAGVVNRLVDQYGATPLADDEDPREWAARVQAELTRPLRHTGNHKYAWGLTRTEKRHMPDGLAYPKMGAVACA